MALLESRFQNSVLTNDRGSCQGCLALCLCTSTTASHAFLSTPVDLLVNKAFATLVTMIWPLILTCSSPVISGCGHKALVSPVMVTQLFCFVFSESECMSVNGFYLKNVCTLSDKRNTKLSNILDKDSNEFHQSHVDTSYWFRLAYLVLKLNWWFWLAFNGTHVRKWLLYVE